MRRSHAFLLAILIAALPTVVSLCELRCTVRPVAASHTAPRPCHGPGHQGKGPRSAAPDEHQDCVRHVLLVRGNGGIEVQIDRATVAIVRPFGSFLVIPGQPLEREELASPDRSPPFGRSSDILRL